MDSNDILMLIEKCFLLQVGKMNEQNFRVEIFANQQLSKVTQFFLNLAGQLGLSLEDVSAHWILFASVMHYLSTPSS